MSGERSDSALKAFCLLFGVQFLQYFLVAFNLRAVAAGLYWWTFVSDLVAAANAYLLIRRIAEAKGGIAFAGYLAGSAFGGMLAIFTTKWLAIHGGF